MFALFTPSQAISVEGEVALYDKLKEVIEWTWDMILTKIGYYKEEDDFVGFAEEDSQHTQQNRSHTEEEYEKSEKKAKESKTATGDINIEITQLPDTDDQLKATELGHDQLIVTFKTENVTNV